MHLVLQAQHAHPPSIGIVPTVSNRSANLKFPPPSGRKQIEPLETQTQSCGANASSLALLRAPEVFAVNYIRPLVGVNRRQQISIVDLPQPDGPITATNAFPALQATRHASGHVYLSDAINFFEIVSFKNRGH
jgi:hypothetical protein